MIYDKKRMTLNNIPLKKRENDILTIFTTVSVVDYESLNRALGTARTNTSTVAILKFNKVWEGIVEIKNIQGVGYYLKSKESIEVVSELKLTDSDKRFLKYKERIKKEILEILG